jgi:ABC-2 type transport system ATP-binding protein
MIPEWTRRIQVMVSASGFVGPIVEVNDLVKKFGDHVAVDGISFTIDPGEVFGLLGPNGAGKSTTIQVLTTLIPPTSGDVRIAGLDVRRDGGLIRQLLGYVPQSLSADGALTGYENLLVVAKLLGLNGKERQRRIQDILALLQLEDAADRLVQHYSGGMVRRLEIGQAILHQPHILILDEPTIGLDPTARRTVWETLEVLRCDTGMTMLVTTHYMEEAEAYCQRVAIMNLGRIVAIGTPEALKASIGRPEGTLEDVFTEVTGNTLESGGSFHDVRQLRRRAGRFS